MSVCDTLTASLLWLKHVLRDLVAWNRHLNVKVTPGLIEDKLHAVLASQLVNSRDPEDKLC